MSRFNTRPAHATLEELVNAATSLRAALPVGPTSAQALNAPVVHQTIEALSKAVERWLGELERVNRWAKKLGDRQ